MTRFSRRIVYVITDLKIGGAEMMLWKLLSNSTSRRYQPTVVTLVDGGDLADRIRNLGIRVVSLGMRPGSFSPQDCLKLRRLGRELVPDVVQGWMYHGNLAAHILAGAGPSSCKLFWSIRQSLANIRSEKKTTQMVVRLGAWLSAAPMGIVFNSKVSIEHHVRYGYPRHKAVYIGNGFDLGKYRPRNSAKNALRERIGVGATATLVGQIGRYHPVKGYDIFWAAAADVVRRNPDVHFLCVGRGLNGTLADFIEAPVFPELSLNVHFLGETDDIQDILAGLDVVCSCSRAEAFANIVGEAMATGVPCVVSDVGDSAALVGDVGTVVDAEDAFGTAIAILETLDRTPDERSEIGRKLRLRIERNYSIAKVVADYENLYDAHCD